MYIWLNHSNRNNHIKKVLLVVKNIDHIFCMASELLEFDKLCLFLILDGTLINDNGYLESLDKATVLISEWRNRCVKCLFILV